MTDTTECHRTDDQLHQRIEAPVADHPGRCQSRTFQALAELDQAIVAGRQRHQRPPLPG
jgi:hypothetical protein